MAQSSSMPATYPGFTGPIEDLEYAFITRIVDLGILVPVLYAIDAGDSSVFKSERCKKAWLFILAYHRDNRTVPTRAEVKEALQGDMRFVSVPHALIPMAERLWKGSPRNGGRFGR